MKNNLSKILVGSLIAGALTFLPAPEGVKQVYAGEDVTNNRLYSPLKESRINAGAKRDFTMEREGSLLIERHTLERGEDPVRYAKKINMPWCGIFKENKLEFILEVQYKMGNPGDYTNIHKNRLVNDIRTYLGKPERKGYQAIIRKKDGNISYVEMIELIKSASE